MSVKNRIKTLLSYKNKDYQKKYYILSRLYENKLYENEDLYEEFLCLVKTLNISNGNFPEEKYLYEFLEKSFDSYKIKNIKEYVNLKYSNYYENYQNLISEELDKINFNNKKLDSKLENSLIKSINENINLFEIKDYFILDLLDEPSQEELDKIEKEYLQDEEDFQKEELKSSDIQKEKIKKIFDPIIGKDPLQMTSKEVERFAKALGYTSSKKYNPETGDPRQKASEKLALDIDKFLGSEKNPVIARKYLICFAIETVLMLEKQMNAIFSVPDDVKEKMSTDVTKGDVKDAIFKATGRFGAISESEIEKIYNELHNELTMGEYDLSSEKISEKNLLKLYDRASLYRKFRAKDIKNQLDAIYPLENLNKKIEKQSQEEIEATRKEVEDYFKKREKEDEEIFSDEIDPETGEALYADEEQIKKINLSKEEKQKLIQKLDKDDIIDVPAFLKISPIPNQIRMTSIEAKEFLEQVKEDLERLDELVEKSKEKTNPAIFDPFRKTVNRKTGKEEIIPDSNLIPDIIPAVGLTSSEKKEIKQIIKRLSMKNKISMINFDKKGEFYNQILDNGVNVEIFLQHYMHRFGLDKQDEPMYFKDIARASFGRYRDTPGVRQSADKAWKKELFFSSNLKEKSKIYAAAGDLWVERLIRLDLLEDKAFVRIPSKENPDNPMQDVVSQKDKLLDSEDKLKNAVETLTSLEELTEEQSEKLKYIKKILKIINELKESTVSETFEIIEKYISTPKTIERYFSQNSDENLEGVVNDKINQIRIMADSEDEFDAFLLKAEKEDKDIAAYAVLDSMFNGLSGFRFFVSSLCSMFYNTNIWSSTEKDLCASIKKYFDKHYGKDIVAKSLPVGGGVADFDRKEGRDLFPKIIYLVMERTGVKATGSKKDPIPDVGYEDVRGKQEKYFLGLTGDTRGDFVNTVRSFNEEFRQDGNQIKGINGGEFDYDDVKILLDDMFNPNGIIGSNYEKYKRLSKVNADEMVSWMMTLPEEKIDKCLINGLTGSLIYTKKDIDLLMPSVEKALKKDTEKALEDYKKFSKGMLLANDFKNWLDYERGYEPAYSGSK